MKTREGKDPSRKIEIGYHGKISAQRIETREVQIPVRSISIIKATNSIREGKLERCVHLMPLRKWHIVTFRKQDHPHTPSVIHEFFLSLINNKA